MRLVGSRKRNTYAKYGSMTTRPSAVAAIIASTAARGTKSSRTDRLKNTPHTQATTKYAITRTLTRSRRNMRATPV